MKKTIFFLIAITILFVGCKKTDKVIKKLYGVYQLTNYTVGGVESLESYKDSLGTTFTIRYEDYAEETYFYIDGKRKDGKDTRVFFTWALLEEGDFLCITYTTGNIGIGPFGFDKKPLWHILSLSDSELIMKTNFIGVEYVVFLKE